MRSKGGPERVQKKLDDAFEGKCTGSDVNKLKADHDSQMASRIGLDLWKKTMGHTKGTTMLATGTEIVGESMALRTPRDISSGSIDCRVLHCVQNQCDCKKLDEEK